MSLVTALTIGAKSVTAWLAERRRTLTPFALSTCAAAAATIAEYGSASSTISTFFAWSFSIMKSASDRPCIASLPTTRENVGYAPPLSTTEVADESTAASPARVKVFPTAVTSCEPAGPIVASSVLSAANAEATLAARFGASRVSAGRNVKCVPFAALNVVERVARPAELVAADRRVAPA